MYRSISEIWGARVDIFSLLIYRKQNWIEIERVSMKEAFTPFIASAAAATAITKYVTVADENIHIEAKH